VKAEKKILIVVPDITRKAHLKAVLPRMLRRAQGLGPRAQGSGEERSLPEGDPRTSIKIIVGTGLHKPHTNTELKSLVGENIFSKYTVVTHSQDKKCLVYKGRTRSGIPVVLNRNVYEADIIMTVGLIEPHLYAGYSGGAKAIAIGLAGEDTINATHHPRFLDNDGTAIGSLQNNPFQKTLWEIVSGLPVKHSINVVNDREGRLLKIFEGGLKESFAEGVSFAKRIFEKRMKKSFDAVICSVGSPKDVNLYQASRAFNYVLNTGKPIVKKGGIVLVRASLRDGFGRGIAEKRFSRAMKVMKSPQDFINKIKQGGCVAGEHRAYMVAKALKDARLGFIGQKAYTYSKGCPFLAFPTVKAARDFIKHTMGEEASIYEVSNALSVIISR